jgi:fatty-acyl-CoA synthase
VRTMSNVIWAAMDRPSDSRPHLQCWSGKAYEPFTWDDWRRGAERSAAGLQARGIQPGSSVAAVLTNSFDVCSAVIGAWIAGVTLLSLPTPRRGMPLDEYVAQLERLCAASGVEALLLEAQFADALRAAEFATPIVAFSDLQDDGPVDAVLLDADAPAFVQFSSGSTGDPRGVSLTMGAISRQEEMLAEGLHVDRDSQGVMWLPLSHDMGLFGCVLLSWAAGMRLAVGTPERFLRHPQTWLDDAADVGATITASPNFGLALATRKARTTPPKGRCPMQTVVLGGERIEQATLDAAHEVLGPFGLTRETLTPAYGLAEATLAVTLKPFGEAPRARWIDREAAYGGRLELVAPDAPDATPVVSCGRAVNGATLQTDGADGTGIGRIQLRSDSLAVGYLDAPEATADRFHDGTFLSEDIGFVDDGELYVLGRTDDVLVIAGRNVYARDTEREIEANPGVRPGCAVLIDDRRDGQPYVVLLVEPAQAADDYGPLADELAEAVFHNGGFRVAACAVVRPGKLPKTPSGKIQRFRCRAFLRDSGADVLQRVEM